MSAPEPSAWHLKVPVYVFLAGFWLLPFGYLPVVCFVGSLVYLAGLSLVWPLVHGDWRGVGQGVFGLLQSLPWLLLIWFIGAWPLLFGLR